MTRAARYVRRWGYQLTLVALLAFIVGAGGFILVVALPDLQASSAATPAPSPTASASAPTTVMSWVSIPEDADCTACHATAEGAVGTPEVPPIAHPLKGWTDCTACHSNDRLVATAPGHTGIHASDCLLCHQPSQLPAPLSRPHRELQNQDCLTCHGSTAPLPADMSHRSQSVCWLCHRLPQVEPPVPQHAVSAGQRDCLTCHVAGVEGPLPADHDPRGVDECLLCHAPQPASSPAASVPVPAQTPSLEPPPVTISRAGWWPALP